MGVAVVAVAHPIGEQLWPPRPVRGLEIAVERRGVGVESSGRCSRGAPGPSVERDDAGQARAGGEIGSAACIRGPGTPSSGSSSPPGGGGSREGRCESAARAPLRWCSPRRAPFPRSSRCRRKSRGRSRRRRDGDPGGLDSRLVTRSPQALDPDGLQALVPRHRPAADPPDGFSLIGQVDLAVRTGCELRRVAVAEHGDSSRRADLE